MPVLLAALSAACSLAGHLEVGTAAKELSGAWIAGFQAVSHRLTPLRRWPGSSRESAREPQRSGQPCPEVGAAAPSGGPGPGARFAGPGRFRRTWRYGGSNSRTGSRDCAECRPAPRTQDCRSPRPGSCARLGHSPPGARRAPNDPWRARRSREPNSTMALISGSVFRKARSTSTRNPRARRTAFRVLSFAFRFFRRAVSTIARSRGSCNASTSRVCAEAPQMQIGESSNRPG